MPVSCLDKRAVLPKSIVHPSKAQTVMNKMNSQHYLILAEIEFWRDTLRTLEDSITEAEQERMHQALILAQNKLIAFEMTAPRSALNAEMSVAYH